MQLPEGSTVKAAVDLAMAQWLQSQPSADHTTLSSLQFQQPGIWGKKVPWTQVVQAEDRIELYRPLKVDPKVARRERFAKQGARSTGLFASKRPGAKAGY